MEDQNPNEIVLSYHNSLLRNSDLDLLRGNHWINDNIIGFYLEYIFNDRLSYHKKTDILCVSPELTQLLKLTDPAHYDKFLGPLDADNMNFIFFPINNLNRRDAPGGTHWSLLVYSKEERTYFHFDSFLATNSSTASIFTKKLLFYFEYPTEFTYMEKDCPQQENEYDCGLHVICNIDAIVHHLLQNSTIDDCKFDNVSTHVKTKREDLLRLIKDLKKKKEQMC